MRERIAEAIWAFDESIGEVPVDWSCQWDELPNGVHKVYGLRADAVLAVLPLPAVARLLADPATVAGLVDLLSGVDWHYETPEAERAGRALLAALTGDQAATSAANGGGDESHT